MDKIKLQPYQNTTRLSGRFHNEILPSLTKRNPKIYTLAGQPDDKNEMECDTTED